MAGIEHAGSQFDSYKAKREADAHHAAASKDLWKGNQGQIRDGDAYTGATILYGNHHNRHEHVGWSGELHGTWGADTAKGDPATELLASAGPTKVGNVDYHPTYALLHSEHPGIPGLNITRSQHLRLNGARELRDRAQGRAYKESKQAGK
jgi:hypothetical protein